MKGSQTIEKTAEQEPGFDDEVTEWLDATRMNERAGIAVITGIDVDSGAENAVIRFDLPHGEQSFEEEFNVGTYLGNSVRDLLGYVGLDPLNDSVEELDGRVVPVKKGISGWRVELDDDTGSSSDTDPIPSGVKTLANAGSLAGVAGLVLTPVGVAVGAVAPIFGVLLFAASLILRVLGEAAFISLRKQVDESYRKQESVKAFERYIDKDPSITGFLFHLLTGGRLLR